MNFLPRAGWCLASLAALLGSVPVAAELQPATSPLAYHELVPGAKQLTAWLRKQLEILREYSPAHLGKTYSKPGAVALPVIL
jgi:hypothetical protein